MNLHFRFFSACPHRRNSKTAGCYRIVFWRNMVRFGYSRIKGLCDSLHPEAPKKALARRFSIPSRVDKLDFSACEQE